MYFSRCRVKTTADFVPQGTCTAWSFRGALSIEDRPSTRSASETVIESLPYTIMKSHHSEIVVIPSNGLWRLIFQASGWKRRSQVMKGAAMSGVCQRF